MTTSLKQIHFLPKNIESDSLKKHLTCFGWSAAFCGSVFTLLLGWLVILVTGCLKIEAVWRTGNVVFRSGLALRKDKHMRLGSTLSQSSCIVFFLFFQCRKWLCTTSEKLPCMLTDCPIVWVVTHSGLQCPYVIMCSVRDDDSIAV